MTVSNDEVARRVGLIGTGVCTQCAGTCDLDKSLCGECISPRRGRVRETDPYRKVWDTVDDHEKELMESVKNGTLFCPTPAIIAERHRNAERYYRGKAENTVGAEALVLSREAEIESRLAGHMDNLDVKIKKAVARKEFSFIVRKGA